jgi:hypothetical protein
MVATILKGFHYSFGITPKIYTIPTTISKQIIFTDSCRYNLNSDDQLDINKLFGIGYFPSHHHNSVRFGWRYDLKQDKIEVLAYWYENKVRKNMPLFFANIGKKYEYNIHALKYSHTLSVKNVVGYSVFVPSKRYGFSLNPYFGGNRRAPHTMKIIMD